MLAKKRQATLKLLRKIRSGIARAGRLNEELPDFRQTLKGALPQGIRIRGNTPPADQAQLASTDRILNSSARILGPGRRSKQHAHAKQLVQVDLFFGGAGAEKVHW